MIHAFVVKKFQDYIAAHPSELREPEPTTALPAKPVPISPHVYTPQQWVVAHVAEAEQLLWGNICKQCQTLGAQPARRFSRSRNQTLRCDAFDTQISITISIGW
ncbi:MAG: hypothetical protein WBD66_01295 [Candidatus Acidiferrales bacterium]